MYYGCQWLRFWFILLRALWLSQKAMHQGQHKKSSHVHRHIEKTSKRLFPPHLPPLLDVDECSAEDPVCKNPYSICYNTEGSYQCACETGYIAQGEECLGECTAWLSSSCYGRGCTLFLSYAPILKGLQLHINCSDSQWSLSKMQISVTRITMARLASRDIKWQLKAIFKQVLSSNARKCPRRVYFYKPCA